MVMEGDQRSKLSLQPQQQREWEEGGMKNTGQSDHGQIGGRAALSPFISHPTSFLLEVGVYPCLSPIHSPKPCCILFWGVERDSTTDSHFQQL